LKQGILLAAGFSRRFGAGNKLLQPLADGTPMVLAAARKLRAALTDVLIVINSDADTLRHLLLENDFDTTICPHADQGMGASLAWAVRATSAAAAWIIALGDMPYIEMSTYRGVADMLVQPWDIAAPVFQGQRGHPVGFGEAYRKGLVNLTGDQGARILLQGHKEYLKTFACEDEGVVLDIDTVDELSVPGNSGQRYVFAHPTKKLLSNSCK
jgi:molybdenum cofactor cytidylyltransferase